MEKKILKSKIEQLIQSIYPTVYISSLYEDTSMVTVLNMDSIGFVSLIIAIEELIGTQITSTDIYNMDMLFSDFLSIVEKEIV